MLKPRGMPQPMDIFLQGESARRMPLALVERLLEKGRLAIQLGNYAFDEVGLERAVRLFVSTSKLKTVKLSWTSEFSQAAAAAGPSTVGLTFMKQ